MVKRNPVKTTLIKDLPQEVQDWLYALPPPKKDTNFYVTGTQKRGSKTVKKGGERR